MKNLIRVFQVFKEGVTADWVTILIPEKDPCDALLEQKINKYIFLGYKIKSL